MSLDQLFEQFLRECTYVHNVTPKTRDWYQSAWHAFKQSQPRPATEIIKADLLAFVVHLRERGVKPVSCATRGISVIYGSGSNPSRVSGPHASHAEPGPFFKRL